MRNGPPLSTLCGISLWLLLAGSLAAQELPVQRQFSFSGEDSTTLDLEAGETLAISVGVVSPSFLPPNGRIAAQWEGPGPNLGWRKILHALDPDIYLVYRAPVSGRYTLSLSKVEDEVPDFNRPRWRESGSISQLALFPEKTPWPTGLGVPFRVALQPVDLSTATRGLVVELEPNNSLEQAQPLQLTSTDEDQILSVTGSADDCEYFDNGRYGESGHDWFRIECASSQPRLLTVNMLPTDPLVAARVRCYLPDGQEFVEGKHLNESTHEQVEEHRTAIVRLIQPGGVYFLCVEANSPGYDLEIRIRRPAPFTDPREAVRLAMYDHIAQVSAWLMNRPRGNSLDRRIRETGSMYGTNCMSCHTQSGVWGPAVPLAFGYGIENPLHYRHLINIMYESLRPTNKLVDAANNTSLPPHDLGDGPAGTRIAGHNVLTAETVIAPRKLHSKQQIRTANYVLQTSDPSGINAAGKGSNVGRSVVIHYAAEILRRAWDKTGEARYLDGIEQRAKAILKVEPQYTDDVAHRVLFLCRVFPGNFVELKGNPPASQQLVDQISRQLKQDEETLRAGQREDGGWGFSPGKPDTESDPAPTALALDALAALGATPEDPAIVRGVPALLAMQRPYGLWNKSARTGFVTTSYVLNTLARLFPDSRAPWTRADFEARPGEPLQDQVARMRALARLAPWSSVSTSEPPEAYLDLMLAGTTSDHAPVRYWSLLALGALHTEAAVPALIKGVDDPVKMVREAARWGLRQTLLDDRGWDQVLAACESGSDLQREQLAAALVIRADTVMPGSTIDLSRLGTVLDRWMCDDANPAVRAWSARAAWNWWLWNPPIRRQLNQAYCRLLETPEPSAIAENAKRYQLQALLIVNGNRAAANYDNPYSELAELFEELRTRLEPAPLPAARAAVRLASERLTAVAATYHNAAYGANGTGQLGYATPHSSEAIGKAVLQYWDHAEWRSDARQIQLAVEAAANIIDEDIQQKLLHYSIEGPELLRPVAANSLSDPRAVLLPTSPEFVGPLMERIITAAQTEEGRQQVVRRNLRQLSQARWDLGTSEGRQREFFRMLVPKMDDPQSDVQWFLAEQLGALLANNPDFRTETLISLVPETFENPLQEAFWLPSAGWMLHHDSALPEIGQPAQAPNRPDLRRKALDLYLRNLSPDVDRRLRTIAVSMLYQPALNTHPDVVAAAGRIDVGDFKHLLPETFDREIRQVSAQDQREPAIEWTPERLRNLAYFRDFVVPELGIVKREDGNSCFSCHGDGKVPSLSLAAPDRRTRYVSPEDVWTNYRVLLERVDPKQVQQSKLLRKPLNVQTGEEDGHQGGARYKPGDRGHEILKRWAEDAARLWLQR